MVHRMDIDAHKIIDLEELNRQRLATIAQLSARIERLRNVIENALSACQKGEAFVAEAILSDGLEQDK